MLQHSPQSEFDFGGGDAQNERGFHLWRQDRRRAMEGLAHKMGLPLYHLVEIWLQGGVRLRGTLRMQEEKLFVDDARDFNLVFVVDGTSFTAGEIESCVKLDS